MFQVTINPFEQTIEISKNNEGVFLHHYKELDEWFSFIHEGALYDAHFCYDYKPNLFSIYIAYTWKDIESEIKII